MSSPKYALAEYIVNNIATPTVSAVVPSLVYTDAAPQGTVDDHIVITHYGDDPNNTLGGMGGLFSGEFDIDCKSSDPEVAAEMARDVKDELDLLLNSSLNADWVCGAVIINNVSEGYEPPPGDGQDISIFMATLEITMQYRSS
ncbi:MAG: hypothetical protein HUJ26_18980 [Planctomycetaceae bacterium]|nr:hypothetical protein [Planctomycetaceae bacterium]